jgi:hypothetical protein
VTTPTVAVSILADFFNGAAVAGGTVRFTPTKLDVDAVGGSGAIFIPKAIDVALDANGSAVSNFFPNVDGSQGTQYAVQFFDASRSLLWPLPGFTLLATVPATNCNLHDVLNLTAPPALSDAQAAQLAAQEYAAQAGADAVQTAADRVQTGADRTQTGLDRTASVAAAASAAHIIGGTFDPAALPSVRADGSALQAGDICFGTDGYEYARVGSAWVNQTAAAAASAASAAASAGSATASASAALASQNAAGVSAGNAATSEANALVYNNTATIASATAGVYPNTAASNVPRGLTQGSVGAITAGSAGTNGTFALAWSGGNFSINPTGTFTVAGGVLTAVTITGPGQYIGASPTVPTPSFAASAGLAGAAVVLTAKVLVAAGQGYWVQSPDGYSLLRYLNVAGVATADATVGPLGLQNLQSVATDPALPGDLEVTVDSLGYVGKRLTAQGSIGKVQQSITPLANQGKVMHHFLDYGQSLSNGWNSVPPITTAGMFDDVWMFNGGVNTAATSEDPAVSMTSLTGYFEQVQGTSGETPNGGRVARFVQLLRERHGKTLRDAGMALLCSCSGKDGAQISALQKGSTYYTRIINQVTKGKALATAAGYTYKLAGIFFDQGQFNAATAIATYLGTFATTGTGGNVGLYNLHFDLQADLRTVLGDNSFNLKMFLTPTWIDTGLAAPNSLSGPTLAQLAAHAANPDKFIITQPPYPQNTIDGTHWPAFESGLAGAYGAEAYMEQVIYLGGWQCVEPISFTVSGAVVTIRFECPGGQLVFDTRQVRKAANFGFLCTDRTGAALSAASEPVIVGTDRVQITLAADPTLAGNGLRVKYGDFSTQISTWGYVGPLRRTYGNRGNLRDNSGDLAGGIYRHPSNRNSPLHRWCVQFDQVVIA